MGIRRGLSVRTVKEQVEPAGWSDGSSATAEAPGASPAGAVARVERAIRASSRRSPGGALVEQDLAERKPTREVPARAVAVEARVEVEASREPLAEEALLTTDGPRRASVLCEPLREVQRKRAHRAAVSARRCAGATTPTTILPGNGEGRSTSGAGIGDERSTGSNRAMSLSA